MKITVIMGLPGSGKTHLASAMALASGAHVIDDLSVNASETTFKEARRHTEIIITCPQVGVSNPVRVEELLRTWFGPSEITYIGFENDPEACWANVRDRDERIISKSFIMALSREYHPESFGCEMRKVWNS